MSNRQALVTLGLAFLLPFAAPAASQLRPATNDLQLRTWLTNMVTHRFSHAEMSAVLGLGSNEISRRLAESPITPLSGGKSLLVLPYPGGRHPRIGFLDGAVDPQRDTKISVFSPWDPSSYLVIDVPEAIFSNLGLIYLAHTHVPTLWSAKNIQLQSLEWRRNASGSLESSRMLPNGIGFGAAVVPFSNGVLMDLWVTNGTDNPLTDIRVQNCVMLKGMVGFSAQTDTNKFLQTPVAAAHTPDRTRWIITAWNPCHRTWQNPPVPCIHSDPRIPDCPPGGSRRARGVLSFYEGEDPAAEFRRIERLIAE